MTVTYQGSNNWGPCFPTVDQSTAAEPTQPANPEGSPLNCDNTNTGRNYMAVMKWFKK